MLILFTILASVVAREISRTLFPQLHLESYIDGVGAAFTIVLIRALARDS